MDDERDDGPYTPKSFIGRETGTVVDWQWDDDDRTTGSFVDTGREPTPTERYLFALARSDTPFLAAIGLSRNGTRPTD